MSATAVQEAFSYVLDKAEEIYGVAMHDVYLHLDLVGHHAGRAFRRQGMYGIRLNIDLLGRSPDHLINDTLPHEVAHIVCFKTGLGNLHCVKWVEFCKSLGGTGIHQHNEPTVYSKGPTYEYTTTKGLVVRINHALHTKVQSGNTYRYDTAGDINKACAVVIVGFNGITLANPVSV